MVQEGSVGICVDEAFGPVLAPYLRRLRAPGAPGISDSWELDLVGTSDEVLLYQLGQRGFAALVTRDSKMLSATVRRDVWRSSGLSVFLCDGKWGNLKLFELARRLIWHWPAIVTQAREGPQGGAWRVSIEHRAGGLERVLA